MIEALLISLMLSYIIHKAIDYNGTNIDDKTILLCLISLIMMICTYYIYNEYYDNVIVKESLIYTSMLLAISTIMNMDINQKEVIVFPIIIASRYYIKKRIDE